MNRDEVHLWLSSLDPSNEELQRLHALLSLDELARAERFLVERERMRFIAAHGILRRILAAYLGIDPRDIDFDTGPRGKPSIRPPLGIGWQFNMAHSCGLGLWVIARGRRVGVDLERIRPAVDCARVGAMIFSPAEAAEFASLPPPQQVDAFFLCWTRKEAYIKATGDGFAQPLREINISMTLGQSRSVHVAGSGAESNRWFIQDLDLPDGYVGALVVEELKCSVAWRALPDFGERLACHRSSRRLLPHSNRNS